MIRVRYACYVVLWGRMLGIFGNTQHFPPSTCYGKVLEIRSWDMETECKKLSVAVHAYILCAYILHACLAIRQPMSKEARYSEIHVIC